MTKTEAGAELASSIRLEKRIRTEAKASAARFTKALKDINSRISYLAAVVNDEPAAEPLAQPVLNLQPKGGQS